MNHNSHLDIDYVAQLARLELDDSEKKILGAQLDAILDHFEALKSVDVSGVEPTAHAHAVENVWREGDVAGPVFPPETLMKMAPESRDNQVVVPKVIE
jgi:aspartyl-tRNA(Asn)/glutamyl-tRNA(Gln) amidotransferase subunit C